jgi:hypothetical protein
MFVGIFKINSLTPKTDNNQIWGTNYSEHDEKYKLQKNFYFYTSWNTRRCSGFYKQWRNSITEPFEYYKDLLKSYSNKLLYTHIIRKCESKVDPGLN